jgi:hypothetical protein
MTSLHMLAHARTLSLGLKDDMEANEGRRLPRDATIAGSKPVSSKKHIFSRPF